MASLSKLKQDGLFVVAVSGPRERALAEIVHYAAVYGKDGPVSIWERERSGRLRESQGM